MLYPLLWLRGLSYQRKIYLGSASLIGGSAVTGTLAFESTREAASELLNKLFSESKDSDAKPEQRNEEEMIYGFPAIWHYFKNLGNYTWDSTRWVFEKIIDGKETASSVWDWTKFLAGFAYDYHNVIWELIKSTFSDWDLRKLLSLLNSEQWTAVTGGLGGSSDAGGGSGKPTEGKRAESEIKTLMDRLKKIVEKSKEINFDSSSFFKKVLKSLFENPKKLSDRIRTVNVMLQLLEKVIDSKDQLQVMQQLFSEGNDEKIIETLLLRRPLKQIQAR
ncbi:hypothetical protein MHLP_03655 [Candidatus Mycoplasma haematolamae str. Purdue]|uniref:Uncharacterized protein n=1 Tax=Mycoplasma haematolamae (strain Purdue) TaxID=1212765 RepID=I7CGC2_MYCHA|nr:hypothetical protein [Candidatus Mycoplasma haematolamae]AFO52311.1 hypothetical protein MHLP_03655 [Candidatus Mycoplasma haematolamae str. Purdue]